MATYINKTDVRQPTVQDMKHTAYFTVFLMRYYLAIPLRIFNRSAHLDGTYTVGKPSIRRF